MAEREGLLGAARLAPTGPPFGRYPRFVAVAVICERERREFMCRMAERGIDSGLRPSPFGRRVRVVQNRLRRFCRTPFLISRVRTPASWLPRLSDRKPREFVARLAEREGFEPSMGF